MILFFELYLYPNIRISTETFWFLPWQNPVFYFLNLIPVFLSILLIYIGFLKDQSILAHQNSVLIRKKSLFVQRRNSFISKVKRVERKNESFKSVFEKLKAIKLRINISTENMDETEIQEQNDILSQIQEELITQQDFIVEQSKELQNQFIKTESSIKSAFHIQHALLPTKRKMDNMLKDYFVFYQPKDVVSGDLWWLEKIGNKRFLAIIDCTGHGVPGAFMTLIAYALLDKIILTRGTCDPASILEMMHDEICIFLQQEESGNNDGMDISLICMEDTIEGVQIEFSGARNGFYYIPAGQNEILEIKGNRKYIGGFQNPHKKFSTQKFMMEKGSWIYMCTDGYQDQNNDKNKRFGKHIVQNLLLTNHNSNAERQKELLEQSLNEYRGDCPQRDDVLFVGLKL